MTWLKLKTDFDYAHWFIEDNERIRWTKIWMFSVVSSNLLFDELILYFKQKAPRRITKNCFICHNCLWSFFWMSKPLTTFSWKWSNFYLRSVHIKLKAELSVPSLVREFRQNVGLKSVSWNTRKASTTIYTHGKSLASLTFLRGYNLNYNLPNFYLSLIKLFFGSMIRNASVWKRPISSDQYGRHLPSWILQIYSYVHDATDMSCNKFSPLSLNVWFYA